MNKKLTTFMALSLSMLGGSSPYGYEHRPKRDYHFEPSDPHQDKGVVGKPIRKGAGRRLTRAQRKKLNGR